MKIHRGLKGKLYPNKKQQEKISRTVGCCRKVFNLTLEAKYRETKDNRLTKNKAFANLVELKKAYPYLKDVDANALQHAAGAVFTAFHNYFENPAHFGLPRFKSKKKSKKSYTTSCYRNNIRIENGRISLPKLGWIKLKLSRPLPKNGRLISATVTERSDGLFELALDIEIETQDPKILVPDQNNLLGLDFMMDRFYADSDGNFVDYPKWFRKYEKKLARAQRKLTRCRRGSKGYEKQRLVVAKIQQKIADKRNDFLHQLSRELVDKFDFIAVEDLNMIAMGKALRFGKSVFDHGWGKFRVLLSYKLEEKGGALIKIPKDFPSTQLCQCGYQNSITKGIEGLKVKIITCPVCGTTYNRDLNAAINIKNEAFKVFKSQIS